MASRSLLSFSAAALVATQLLACGGPSDDLPDPPGQRVQSEVERNLAPDVPVADQTALISGNADFAVDAYHHMRDLPGNVFYSPLSVSIAMAMTYAGARGETEVQMADALHYTLPQDDLHPAFNWLDLELSSRGQGAQGADGDGFRLNLINNTFGQLDHQFLPEYLDLLAENYGAGMSLLDFENDPEGARQAINQWVADMTANRIADLLPQGSVDPSTHLVLANAVYFNAAWKTPFEPAATNPGTFHGLSGDLTVPMMNGEVDGMTYTSGEGYEAVALPYDGDEVQFVMLIPDEGSLDAFESQLDGTRLLDIFDSLTPGPYGAIRMPSFSFRYKTEMIDIFQQLGLVDAFDSRADFSGIDGRQALAITGIFHEAFIALNEAGTEAAAATGVVVGETSVPQVLVVDRPFVFAIRDVQTNTVVFLGRVVDPSAP